MSLKLLINIGNTHTTVATLDMQIVLRCKTVELLEKIKFIEADIFYCASVVPDVQQELEKIGRDFRFLGHEHLPNVDFTLVEASTLGSDRLANLLAVTVLFPESTCLTVDCGTCVTGELQSRGQFLGGFIHPGRQIQRQSLNAYTGALPEVPLAATLPELEGRNTAEAILAGVDRFSFLAMKSYVAELKRDYPDLKVVLTGGDAAFYTGAFKQYELIEDLSLRGLETFARS